MLLQNHACNSNSFHLHSLHLLLRATIRQKVRLQAIDSNSSLRLPMVASRYKMLTSLININFTLALPLLEANIKAKGFTNKEKLSQHVLVIP